MGIIGVVNYGCGNIQSVINAIEFLGYEFRLIENKECGCCVLQINLQKAYKTMFFSGQLFH